MFNTTSGAPILKPEEVAELVVRPFIEKAVCTSPEISQLVDISEGSALRIPVVAEDPAASWVTEGAEIATSAPTMSEVVINPAKVAAITRISHELMDDSSPEAIATAGGGLVRDLARKVDEAFFSKLAAPAPQGLEHLATSTLEAPLHNTDPFVEAMSVAENKSSQITAFVTNPDTALTMAKVKRAEGSNEPLLQPDPTQPARRLIAGVPLFTCPAVAANTIWALPAQHVFIGMREGTALETSEHQSFTSDVVLLKARMRLAFGFSYPEAIVKITVAEKGA